MSIIMTFLCVDLIYYAEKFIEWRWMNIFQDGNSCYRHQTSTNADQNLYSDIQIRKSTEKMNTRVCTLCWEYLTYTLP